MNTNGLRNTDPQHIGEALLAARRGKPKTKLSKLADPFKDFREFPLVPSMSTATTTAVEYRAELAERAGKGDMAAQMMLETGTPLEA